MLSVSEKLKDLILKFKNPKVLVTLGLIGIVLIFLSSFLGNDNEDIPPSSDGEQINTNEYCTMLENKIKGIVQSISGDENAYVVITLENGVRYSYADATQSDNTSSLGKESEHLSESTTQSYITVKTADGGEKALIVTEYMPEVKGVAVICNGGEKESIAQKIENAVTSALNITSKRVYITGGTGK